jgi:hypothetical protein
LAGYSSRQRFWLSRLAVQRHRRSNVNSTCGTILLV